MLKCLQINYAFLFRTTIEPDEIIYLLLFLLALIDDLLPAKSHKKGCHLTLTNNI